MIQTNLVASTHADLSSLRNPCRVPKSLTREMSESEYNRFIRNRGTILTFTYWLLRPFSFDPLKFAARMTSIDAFVVKSAEAIACSERTGVVVSLSLSLGLGLSDKIIERISSPRLKSMIPNGGGFYYVVSLGFGVFVRQRSENRKALVLELFSDIDRLDTVHTYAAEGSIAVNWGVAVDSAKSSGVSKLDSHYVGILGVVRQSPEHFSYSLITGIAFPPYLPIGMVYSNKTSRARAVLPEIPLLRRPSADVVTN